MSAPTTTAGPALLRVQAAYARLAEVDRPEVWIALRPEDEVRAEAAVLDARVAAGEDLALAGLLVGVKDNVDVAGLDTTAACPAFAYRPAATATTVARLQEAGAIVLGKTNLDQFATGLTGTRSPYGAVRHAWLPDRVSGGSSSGSAVAVALGIVDLGVGTDTAGSGRVPAAFHGIVGLKPTPGLLPTDGVVPAARSYDCVSVFARSLALAERAVAVMTEALPPDAPLAAPPAPVVAVPALEQLAGMSASWREAFALVVEGLPAQGMTVLEVDVEPFLEAAAMLYGSALVAERWAAFGAFAGAHPEACDPSVFTVVQTGRDVLASDLLGARQRVDSLRQEAMSRLVGADVLLLPTTPEHPSPAQVAAEPHDANARLGRFTNFANLFGLAAVAVPAGEVQGGPFGVTVLARPFADAVATDVARRLLDEPDDEPAPGLALLVIGAHLRGQPLHHQLVAAGARFTGAVQTAAQYRLLDLGTVPAKPGLELVGAGGASVRGELFRVPPAGLGHLLAGLPAPMVLGPVLLADGRTVTGFLCHLAPDQPRRDISAWGGWLPYLDDLDDRARADDPGGTP